MYRFKKNNQFKNNTFMNQKSTSIFTPIFIGGSLILLISFAARSSFGLFQIPIETEFDWPRAEFSLAIAIQNLFWGLATPFFGAFAEKLGDRKAILCGGILYAIGMFISSNAITPEAHQLLNVVIGCGIAGTGFGPISYTWYSHSFRFRWTGCWTSIC